MGHFVSFKKNFKKKRNTIRKAVFQLQINKETLLLNNNALFVHFLAHCAHKLNIIGAA